MCFVLVLLALFFRLEPVGLDYSNVSGVFWTGSLLGLSD